MLALTAFRAAARQVQWRTSTGAPSAAVRRANSTSTPGSMSELSDTLRAEGEAHPDHIITPASADPAQTQYLHNPLIKGDVKARGFLTNTFQKPFDYTYKERTKGRAPYKLPVLGPSAAESRRLDVFHQLGIDPLHECQNSSLMSHYLTDMGKIPSRAFTKLTWKNQRRLGKAVRRAKMMGIIPILSRRPLSYGYTKS